MNTDHSLEACLAERARWERSVSLWTDWRPTYDGEEPPVEVQTAEKYVMSVLDSPSDPAAG